MNKPLVSVVIPTYNGEKYIKKAVESVQNQTYQNMEIIIVNDSSSDNTLEILLGLSREDPRVIIETNETNLGFVRSLNKGVENARGKYIARLDDDDVWFNPRKTEKQVEFLEKNEDYVLVGGGMIKVDSNNREFGRYLFPEQDRDIRRAILVDNLFVHSTVIFRKDAWEKAGKYNDKFGFFADLDLWLKLGRLGKFYSFQEYFVYYLDKELSNKYDMRNRDIRRRPITYIRLKKNYKNDYPSYKKAFILCWARYFYSFLPLKKKLHPLLFRLRILIIGRPGYKKYED